METVCGSETVQGSLVHKWSVSNRESTLPESEAEGLITVVR